MLKGGLLHPGHFRLEEERCLPKHFRARPDKEEKVVLLVDGQLDVPESLGPDQVVEDGRPLQVEPPLQRLLSALSLSTISTLLLLLELESGACGAGEN